MKLDGGQGPYSFGDSVSVDGDTAGIGGDCGTTGIGYFDIFVRSGGAWTLQAGFRDGDLPTVQYGFGCLVVVSGDNLAASQTGSAENWSDPPPPVGGVVRMYTRFGTSWSRTQDIYGPEQTYDNLFGAAVSLIGTNLIVGAPGIYSGRGLAYVYTFSGTAWTLQARLAAPDGTAGDRFGTSVALSGDTAIVSAPYKNGNRGTIYIFNRSGTMWSLYQEVTASDSVAGDQFGASVAIDGDVTMAGAPGKAVGANAQQGASYVAMLGSIAPAQIGIPASGSTLSGSSQQFTWSTAFAATCYWLSVGTYPHGTDIYNHAVSTNTTSLTVDNIPTGGGRLYVGLASKIGGQWYTQTYTYEQAGTAIPAQLTNPPSGALISGSTQEFDWDSGSGGGSQYALWLGTTPGNTDLFNGHFANTVHSATVANIPTNGVDVYATLFTMMNDQWRRRSYTFRESGTYTLASMTSPTPGSTLPGDTVTFTWDPGAGPNRFYLYIGSTPGGSDLYSGTFRENITSTTVSGLPTDGRTIYVTLDSYINLIRKPQSYTYTAAGP